MATLDISKINNNSYRERSTKGRLYVDSNVNNLVDDWYSEKEIWGLLYKSKVWSGIKKKATGLINSELKKIEGVEGVVYSRKAGCQCGCSPGYIVSGPRWERKSAWVEITFTDQELQPLKEFLKEQASELLRKEKEENGVAS